MVKSSIKDLYFRYSLILFFTALSIWACQLAHKMHIHQGKLKMQLWQSYSTR